MSKNRVCMFVAATIGVLAVFRVLAREPVNSLDLEYGKCVAGISEFTFDLSNNPVPPASFIGDIDGDGYADAAVGPYIIFGSPERGGTRTIEDTRWSKIIDWQTDGPVLQALGRAGDVDGDGYGDFFVAIWMRYGDERIVRIVLVFGVQSFPPEFNPLNPSAAGLRSTVLSPESGWTGTCKAASAIGDINGDGREDFAISDISRPGTSTGTKGAGWVYVIFGGFDFSRPVDLLSVGSTVPGLIVKGARGSDGARLTGDILGMSLAGVGDINGDGIDDLVVGAPRYKQDEFGPVLGAVYVLFGGAELPAVLEVTASSPHLTLITGGLAGGNFGWSVDAAGDVNGDGRNDFCIGAPGTTANEQPKNPGVAFIVYGNQAWPRIATLSAGGTVVSTEIRSTAYEGLGTIVAGCCDVNADGFADVLVGAPSEMSEGQVDSGAFCVVLGEPGLQRKVQVDYAEVGGAIRGWKMSGTDSLMRLGLAGCAGGDFDGDGRGDAFVVAPYWPREGLPPERSSLFVVYGLSLASRGPGFCRIAPDVGPLAGGTVVGLYGAGFRNGARVLFGDRESPSVEVISSTLLRATVPSCDAADVVDVEIRFDATVLRMAAAFRYSRSAYGDIVLDPDGAPVDGRRHFLVTDMAVASTDGDLAGYAFTAIGDVSGDGASELLISSGPGIEILSWSRALPERLAWADMEDYCAGIGGETVCTLVRDERFFSQGHAVSIVGDADGDGISDLLMRTASVSSIATCVVRGRHAWPRYVQLGEAMEEGMATCLVGLWARAFGGVPLLAEPNAARPPVLGLGIGVGTGLLRVCLDGLDGPSVDISNDITDQQYYDRFGISYSGIGDVNGDGWPDFAVSRLNGPSRTDGLAANSGSVFVVLGGPDVNAYLDEDKRIDQLQLTGHVVEVNNRASETFFGQNVARVGDFDGDGRDDFLIGAPGDGSYFEGSVYVVFGSPELGKSLTKVDIGDPRLRRLRIRGEFSHDAIGWACPALGDYNGDGLADIGFVTGYNVVSKPPGYPTGYPKAPSAYVVFGSRMPGRSLDLKDLGPEAGFKVVSTEDQMFGASSSASIMRVPSSFPHGFPAGFSAGDFDGDGVLDIALTQVRHTDLNTIGLGNRVVVIFGVAPDLPAPFMRGDVNADGTVNIADAITVLGVLFGGGIAPSCEKTADANDDGTLDIADAIAILSHLFAGSGPLPQPFGACGKDPTSDGLGCRTYERC